MDLNLIDMDLSEYNYHGGILTVFYNIAIFAAITWNNSSNDILRALAVTGMVTVFAAIIGLIGCNR
jgi:hypothetical protein